jgi:hypothetical protein
MPSCCRRACFSSFHQGILNYHQGFPHVYCRLILHTLDAVRHQEKSSVVAGKACLPACRGECLQSFPSLPIVSQAVRPPVILFLLCTESQTLLPYYPTTAADLACSRRKTDLVPKAETVSWWQSIFSSRSPAKNCLPAVSAHLDVYSQLGAWNRRVAVGEACLAPRSWYRRLWKCQSRVYRRCRQA